MCLTFDVVSVCCELSLKCVFDVNLDCIFAKREWSTKCETNLQKLSVCAVKYEYGLDF